MKKLLLTAIVGTLACGSAMADQWKLFALTTDEIAFINISDIKKSGNRTAAWAAHVNINPKQPYDTELKRYRVDCDEESMQIQANYQYLRGKQVGSFTTGTKFITPPPGSFGAHAIKELCNPEPSDYIIETDSIHKHVQDLQTLLREYRRIENQKKQK